MIIVRLRGGLGNQLFQYAAGRRLAVIHKTEVVLDLSWFSRISFFDTPRKFELEKYKIKARAVSKKEFFLTVLYRWRVLCPFPFLKVFKERDFLFDGDFLKLADNTYLIGYWQSYLYFEDIQNLIRKELHLNFPMENLDAAIAAKIKNCMSVSLHVRRGDYVSNSLASIFHGTCSLKYYTSAIQYIFHRVPEAHFFVFSDDIEWCRKFLPLTVNNSTFVEHNKSYSAQQDLRLMTFCKHHIIANSSFSWWGAWLNPDIKKIVIAPRKWFAIERQTHTLFPEDWILM